MNSSKTKEIIDYLYKLELMTPFYPNNTIYDSKSGKAFSPKTLGSTKKDPKKQIIYTCFFGEFDYDKAIEKIIETLNLNIEIKKKSDKYKTKSIGFGFKLKEDGSYLEGTFGPSDCLYAINKILENKNINITLSQEESIKSVSSAMKELSEINILSSLFISDLENLFKKVQECFPYIKDELTFEFLITKDELYVSEEKTTMMSPAILTSFYTNDLLKIKENPTPKIIDFLSLNTNKKIQIDKDIKEMKEVLSPEKYPLGKWPSTFTPVLMQQIGINLSLDFEKPVFSINGPPGTGKTTLVKEIIADKIVRRAEILSTYNKPDDAFTYKEITNSQNKDIIHYYKIDPKLSQYGMLVASNNNKAVENISLELPLLIKKSLTTLFDTKENEEIYFTDTANKLFKKESWGLISVPLGKKDNIQSFLKTAYFNEDSESIKNKLNPNSSDFPKAKKEFLQKLKEVKEYQKYLIKVKKDSDEYEKLDDKIKLKEKEYKDENKTLNELLTNEENLEKEKDTINTNITNTEKSLEELNKIIPLIIKIFSFLLRNHKLIVKRKHLTSKISDLTLERIDIKEKLDDLKPIIAKQQEKVKELKQNLENLKDKKEALSNSLKKYTKEDEIILANNDYFKDITSNEVSQESVVWTNKHYDKLREELFYYALNLHKNFIIASNSFKRNFGLIVDALKNTMAEDIRKECYPDLLQTLFLLVPVISTSLASIQRFLSGIPKDTISLLILDEAGQATPASVLGAINRSNKTVILGDPFQLEPVVSTPALVYKLFSQKTDIPNIYTDSTLSAQILADLQNPYGAKRNGEFETWIGCPLLVHRRCQNPMFEISNEIAYENRMFYGTDNKENDKLTFKKSIWYDIKGSAKDNSHYVKEQGEKAIELFEKALKINNYKLPDLFIITPFKDIELELQKELTKFLKSNTNYKDKEIKDWINEKCGTIHTFQGKEANEVILILGCEEISRGVAWASRKPNTLNVAITRAKYRIAIIGDTNLWKNARYFTTAYKKINEKNTSI